MCVKSISQMIFSQVYTDKVKTFWEREFPGRECPEEPLRAHKTSKKVEDDNSDEESDAHPTFDHARWMNNDDLHI
jgi:hypothetical protein